jgi:anaerobic selenocysteine-containing dehydrogenase
LVSRRDATHLNSVRYASGRRAVSVVQIHPDDAAELQIADGDEVEIASDAGAMTGSVRLDNSIRRGVVSASHGRFETNAARLVSGRPGKLDPLTAQPQMSAIAVSIRPTHDTP